MIDDTWVALDFETATSARSSACALGIAVIERGVVVKTESWLIRPPRNRYDYRNIEVHGITPQDTDSAPTFGELYSELLPYLEGRHVVAHSASFDMSVMRAALELYRLPVPEMRYVCSVQMARKAFPQLANHQLPTVCAHCEIDLNHHDAASDALACARVAIACLEGTGEATLHDAVHKLGIKVGSLR